MTFLLVIKQRRVIEQFKAQSSVAQITPAMEGESDHRAAIARRDGRMESGYYELRLFREGETNFHWENELDSLDMIC